MLKIKKQFKKGFSLIEVLITLFILGVGVTSISLLMAKDIKSSQDARNQIVASSLAQEGIELMRNLKDNTGSATLNTPPFDKCSGSCPKIYTGIIDSQNVSTTKLNAGSGSLLNLSGGFFVHASGTATKFYREIITQVDGDSTVSPSTRIITVMSKVWWNGSSTSPSYCTAGNQCLSVTSVMPDYQ